MTQAPERTSHHADVLVLGGGIVGLCVALKLQAQGRSVALVERASPGSGTSLGNAGLIERASVFPYAFPRDWRTLLAYALQRKPHSHYHWRALPHLAPWLWRYWRHSGPRLYPHAMAGALPLIEHSWSEHAPLIEQARAQHLVEAGGWIMAYRHDHTARDCLDQAERTRAFGLQVDTLGATQLRARVPGLGDGMAGGVHFRDPVQVRDPLALSQAYARLFAQRGGVLVQADARSLRREGAHWRVRHTGGDWQAAQAVVTLGPWGADMARQLGYRLPLGIKRGYHMHYAQPTTQALRHVVLDVDHGYVLAPMLQGIRLTTGAEFAYRDAPPTPVQLQQVEPIARRTFPLGERLDAQPWLGARPCTPDMLPLMGPAPAHPGLWFCFGHAHHGLTQAAVSGRLMAELICGQTPFTDPRPYRVDRF